jgi:LysR family hydrogen peroxide-inducible transcriptional activator
MTVRLQKRLRSSTHTLRSPNRLGQGNRRALVRRVAQVIVPFLACDPWYGEVFCQHLSRARKVHYSFHWSNGQKTHSFIGHSDGHPAQSSTTPLSVCLGRAMPFRPCCGKLCRAVTQSTLSGGIKELEARLGVTLFERSHRHVMLTPLGKEIAARAQRLLVDAEDLVGLARNAQEPLSGPLRFGVIPTVGPYVLPSLLPHLGAALPKLKLYVREAQTAVLVDKLAGGELDILLVAIPYELGDVEAMEITEDPIVVAMPRNHPLGNHKVVSRDDLAREQLLLIEDGHCLRTHSLQACRIADPVRNEVFQATSLRTLVQMVAAELGVTLMPQIAVDSELASSRNVVIRPLSPDKPFRTLVLAWRQTSPRGAEFRVLGNLIRECLPGTKTAFAPDQDIEAPPPR